MEEFMDADDMTDGLEESPEGHNSPVPKKLSFNYELDLTLLLEVTTINPFKDSDKWKDVANIVTNSYRAITKNPDFILTSRGSRGRVKLLLDHLSKNDPSSIKALQRGCDEKQYDTKIILLEGIAALKTTAGEKVTAKAHGITKGINADKSKGEAVRKAAMDTQVKRKETNDEDSPEAKRSKPTTRKDSVLMNFMESKRQDEKSVQEQKLALEARRLDLEVSKLEADKTERDRFWANAEEERKLKLAAMQQETESKKMLFDLILNLKK